MFLKILNQLKSIVSYYPKQHSYMIFGCLIVLILIIALSNLDLISKENKQELIHKIPIDKFIDVGSKDIEKTTYRVEETKIKLNDSLFSILKRFGINQKNIIKIINSKNSKFLSDIKIGKVIEADINKFDQIISLDYKIDFQSGVLVRKQEETYFIEKYELKTEKLKVYKKVSISNSLYEDGLEEGIPDSVLMDLVYIFGWDIDFVHDIRPDDSYSLIYEEVYVEGEKKLNGDILIAKFLNRDKAYVAIRYKSANGISEYFSPKGRNVKKAFLRSPVKFSYISSRYNLKRNHPILHKIKPHTGVDYAAPKGTPVRATGDGTIAYADVKGGYGNLVEIKHTEDYSTRYAHLNKVHSKIKIGKKVSQSQIVGYVGSSGTATGDHLHYEFRVNGRHTNPLTIKLPNAVQINSKEKEKFQIAASSLLSELKNFQNLSL